MIKACDVIDLIIEILRGSQNQKQAKACLVTGETEGIRFRKESSRKAAASLHFTENQATAILEMRLYKLIGLEIDALMKEHETTLKNIASYEDILNNYKSMAKVIIRELDALKKEYATPRRTTVENAREAVYVEQGPKEMPVVFLMDRFGYARTVDVSAYERNKEAADSENKYVIPCLNTDKICIFTDVGKQHLLKVMDVPAGKFRDKGTPVDNLCNYSSAEEQVVFLQCLENVKASELLFATEQGMLKKVEGSEFDVAKRTIAATKLQDDDKLLGVFDLEEAKQLVLQSVQGYFLRFEAEEVPLKKKAAVGVRGIRLSEKDRLENVYLLGENTDPVVFYKEKEVHLNRLKIGKRDGKGAKQRL